jgi:transcriptional regulator with XRE-family HTH domain
MFNDWILQQLREKNWSQADLARASGLTTAAISKYINGRIPDQVAMRKIARGLQIHPETAFRAAGILPTTTKDPWQDEMDYMLGQLTGIRRDMAKRLIKTLLEEEQTGQDNSPLPKPAK